MNIKLSFPFSQPMLDNPWPIFRQTPNNSGIWNDLVFHLNNDSSKEYDYWIVYEKLGRDSLEAICKPKNTILITAEPYNNKKYHQKFLDQFGTVVTCQNEIKHQNKILSQEGQPWFINRSYDFLDTLAPVNKSETLCLLLSDRCDTKEHYMRLKFAIELKKHFKGRLHWYGRGIKSFEDKWDILSNYKYSLVFESSVADNYISEKINDCYLAFTYPFYFGTSDLNKLYSDGYTAIELTDVKKSIKIIETIIDNQNHYKNSLETIELNRKKYLTKYQLFALIEKTIRSVNIDNKNNGDTKLITLKAYSNSLLNSKLKGLFNHIRSKKFKIDPSMINSLEYNT